MVESTSSKMMKVIAPNSGPNVVATPPKITININSPERAQSIISGEMNVVKLPRSAPENPQIMPEIT